MIVDGGEAEASGKVRVPITKPDSIYDEPAEATVDLAVAGQWDARRWRDNPLG